MLKREQPACRTDTAEARADPLGEILSDRVRGSLYRPHSCPERRFPSITGSERGFSRARPNRFLDLPRCPTGRKTGSIAAKLARSAT